MKINHYINNWIAAAMMLLLSLFFLPACSNEDDGPEVEEQKYRTLEITINSLSNNSHTTRTKAGETVTVEDDSQYEHRIAQYWLVVLKQDVPNGAYLIDKVITEDDVDYVNPGNGDDDSRTSLTLEVEIGKNYRFYALANLAGLNGGSSLISELESLQSGANFDTFLEKAVSVMSMDNYHTGGFYIPMTSYGYDQYVSETTSSLESGPIELIRLIGKVSLTVTNLTDNSIILNGLSMGKFRTEGNIYLFPYDVKDNTKVLLQEGIDDNYNPTFPSEGTSKNDVVFVGENDNKPQIAANGGSMEFSLYTNETDIKTNGGNDFTITTLIDGRNDQPVESGFDFIRRNDWLKLPIQISNVTSEISFEQKRMPIGGLPTKLTFGNISVPIATCTTQYGGEIKVTFSVTKVDGIDNPILAFWEDPEWTGGTKYTSAELVDNNELGKPILIAGANGAPLPNDNSNAPWLNETAIALKVDSDPDNQQSGSFTVTVQELTNRAMAKILLRLVVTDANRKKEMVIPYTIIIQNKQEEGGN